MATLILSNGDPVLNLVLDGSLWNGGLTAKLTITNTGTAPLADWSVSFESDVQISGTPWGLTFTVSTLANGHYGYTLTGVDWGAALAVGGSVSVGFTATRAAGPASGALQPADLFLTTPVFKALAAAPAPTPSPGPAPAPGPAPLPTPVAEVNPSSYAVKGGGANYAEALQKSFLFYEAQRSGNLDETTNRIDWRGDSGLHDGFDGVYFGNNTSANLQAGLKLDLTGGYHDAGDYGKFGLPLASSLTNLAWGGLQFAGGYAAAGQSDELLAALKWGTDYLLKCNVLDGAGQTRFFVAQVGDADADHNLWQPAETETILRPAMAVTASKPGSDVAGGSAAALAAASMVFRRQGDGAYADKLLSSAVALYQFADTYRGKYSDSIPVVQGFYNSYSGYYDELANGAAWLSQAVKAQGGDGSAYLNKALNLYKTNIGGLNGGWTSNWDDSSYATAVLLAQLTGSATIRQQVEGWLNTWVSGGSGVQITSGGLRWISQWGSLRYAANTAFLADVYASSVNDPGGAYTNLAQQTVDYILGANPRQSSYLVGYGQNFPQQPHSREASGVGWDGFRNGLPNAHINFGALVGGPTQPNDFAYSDVRSDYVSNEVALDYNAGLTGAFARSVELKGGIALTDEELDALPGITIRTLSPTPTPTPTPPPTPAPPPAPSNHGAAVFAITGSAAVGQSLTALRSAEDPDGLGAGGYSYQWQASADGGQLWSAIGSNATLLPLTQAEEGKQIRLTVTYSDAAGFSESVLVAPQSVPYVNDGQASFALIGGAGVGQPLTVSQVQADPDGDGQPSYAWQAQVGSGGAWQAIPGATAASFTPAAAQQGQNLRLRLSYQDRQGFAETVDTGSVAIPAVPLSPPPGPDQPILDPGGAIRPSLPLTSAPLLKVSVAGSLWYHGLTAQITVTNTGTTAVAGWSLSFDTTHAVTGVPWGVSVSQVNQGGGVYRTTLTGKDWATGLAAGAAVTVGFNASQGLGLGDAGVLTGPALFSTSAAQLAASPGNPAYLNGGAGANLLKTGLGTDWLTGLAGKDLFRVGSLKQSLLAAGDRLTDFSIGVDSLDGPNAVAATEMARLGAVADLSEAGVGSLLTASSFQALKAATFSFGSGPTSRTFVALNDGVAGFQASADAVLEISGYAGDLRALTVV
jgi:endoglucanase